MADAQTKLGQLIEGSAMRDAVHIAVAPVIAREALISGTHVGLYEGGATALADNKIGIVDPFLTKVVKPREQFYLFLYPNTITGLKHVWTHPAFDNSDEVVVVKSKKESEAWLRNFIDNADCYVGYDAIIAAARGEKSIDDDCYRVSIMDNSLYIGGHEASGDIPDEFWDHIEVVTGHKQTKRPQWFTCSC